MTDQVECNSSYTCITHFATVLLFSDVTGVQRERNEGVMRATDSTHDLLIGRSKIYRSISLILAAIIFTAGVISGIWRSMRLYFRRRALVMLLRCCPCYLYAYSCYPCYAIILVTGAPFGQVNRARVKQHYTHRCQHTNNCSSFASSVTGIRRNTQEAAAFTRRSSGREIVLVWKGRWKGDWERRNRESDRIICSSCTFCVFLGSC